MESTGGYWIPLYEMLEARGFTVLLVNARHVKNVPGRKSDVSDCQWIQRLHTVGLLRGSFRPTAEITAIRTLLRHRDTLVEGAAACLQRMQKALTLMNLQLHNVISDVTGVTGMLILRDSVAGMTDPAVLARHRHPQCRASEAEIRLFSLQAVQLGAEFRQGLAQLLVNHAVTRYLASRSNGCLWFDVRLR